MHDWSSLNYQQVTSIGGAIGALLAAAYTAWLGYRSKKRPARTMVIPLAAIPPELVGRLDRIESRCSHIEKKIDMIDGKIDEIYTDTQVLRDRKP